MTLDPGLAGRQDRPIPDIDNGFVAGYRVRFDEAGATGQVRSSAFLRYASDIAWRHSEELGFDRVWYAKQGRWWVIKAVELEVLQPVPMGRTLRVATVVVGHGRIWARRRGEVCLPDGTLAAVVIADWVIVDDRGRLLRIPEEFGHAFSNPELRDGITRVGLPPAPPDAARLALRARPQDVDPMSHVNNAVYLDWFEEAVAAAADPDTTTAVPRRVEIEFVASAEPGDAVEAIVWPAGDGWWLRLVRPSDGADLVRGRLSRVRVGSAEAALDQGRSSKAAT